MVSAVTVVPRDEFEDCLPEAGRVMKEIDENDTSFLALAMSFANDGIWSDDLDFQRQHLVPVWRTNDLLELL